MGHYLAADGFNGESQMTTVKRIVLSSVLGTILIVGLLFFNLFYGSPQGFRIGWMILTGLLLVLNLAAMIIYLPKIGSWILARYRAFIEKKAKELNEQSSDPTEDR